MKFGIRFHVCYLFCYVYVQRLCPYASFSRYKNICAEIVWSLCAIFFSLRRQHKSICLFSAIFQSTSFFQQLCLLSSCILISSLTNIYTAQVTRSSQKTRIFLLLYQLRLLPLKCTIWKEYMTNYLFKKRWWGPTIVFCSVTVPHSTMKSHLWARASQLF